MKVTVFVDGGEPALRSDVMVEPVYVRVDAEEPQGFWDGSYSVGVGVDGDCFFTLGFDDEAVSVCVLFEDDGEAKIGNCGRFTCVQWR